MLISIVLVAGMDYPGGWSPSGDSCVDICHDTSQTHSSMFDYLVLEQLYIVQFCLDLFHGIDYTVSHHNINPYPKGLRCQPNRISSSLTLHGLWPNYYDGFPICCDAVEFPNQPLPISDFVASYPDILTQMGLEWIDATQHTTHDTLCQVYNHEFQKHGICYRSNASSSPVRVAAEYFNDTLQLGKTLENATSQLNQWAVQDRRVEVEEIQRLYPKKIELYCSSVEKQLNQFATIRTCWDKELRMIDCPVHQVFGPFIRCNASREVVFESLSID